MDCCNYVSYRQHHQAGYYGGHHHHSNQYFPESFPSSYSGECYGGANVGVGGGGGGGVGHVYHHDYYATGPYHYAPPQHWQGFPPPDYVYNPKEARIRKAIREANRERSMVSPMLQRSNALRPVAHHPNQSQQWMPDDQIMMPQMRCQDQPQQCFPDQFMQLNPTNGYHHHQATPKLETPNSTYMQNPLAQLQHQTEMWPGFHDTRPDYLLSHHHHNNHYSPPSPISTHHSLMPLTPPHSLPMTPPHSNNSLSMTPPHSQHASVPLTPPSSQLTPPHSNENVPPTEEQQPKGGVNDGGGCGGDKLGGGGGASYESMQPLMENNNGFMQMYSSDLQAQDVKAKYNKKRGPLYPAHKTPHSQKALPDFNEAFGSTERGRFQSPPDPNSGPNKRLLDFFFEDTTTGDSTPKFDDFQT